MADESTQATEEITQQQAEPQQGTGERTFTQEEVNKLVGDARKTVRSQFEGYEDLKAKAAAWADYDEVREERDRLAADIARRDLLDKVSAETGVPRTLIHGETEEEMAASAKALSDYIESQRPAYPEDKGGAKTAAGPTRESLSDIKDPKKRLMARARIIEEEFGR